MLPAGGGGVGALGGSSTSTGAASTGAASPAAASAGAASPESKLVNTCFVVIVHTTRTGSHIRRQPQP